MTKKKILYIQYTNPACYPPLEHSSEILIKSGYEALFFGIEVPGVSQIEFEAIKGRKVKYFGSLYQPGIKQKAHYFLYCLRVIFHTLFWRPQWVYASEVLACPVAAVLSYCSPAKILYHEHDSPLPGGESVFMRLCMKARKTIGKRADICVLPNQKRLELFVSGAARKRPSFCVWNCPSKEEARPQKTQMPIRKILLYYHGSLAAELVPPQTIEALAKLEGAVKLTIVGYETAGTLGFVDYLKAKARSCGQDKRVEFLGPPRSRQMLLELCRASDVGMALMPKQSKNINLQEILGASNKVFEYMACGLSVIVSDISEWKEMFVAPGYGLACNPESPESIAEGIKWFVENAEKTRQMGELGRKKILDEWNYEAQFEPVRKIIETSK